MWLNSILETIGNTPLIKLNKITRDLPCTVLAKVEYFNPGNSIKDRMAVKMLEVAEQQDQDWSREPLQHLNRSKVSFDK